MHGKPTMNLPDEAAIVKESEQVFGRFLRNNA
jgi:hypothetical protein